ncbi:MAG: hypothetical protein V3T82_06535 [Nitrospinaceae bacterium]
MSTGRAVHDIRLNPLGGTHLNHGLANAHYALILLGIGAWNQFIGNGTVYSESQYSQKTSC